MRAVPVPQIIVEKTIKVGEQIAEAIHNATSLQNGIRIAGANWCCLVTYDASAYAPPADPLRTPHVRCGSQSGPAASPLTAASLFLRRTVH